eukprot:5817378-Prymnesium_polylepis.1
MHPLSVVETTGGGGGRRHAAGDGAASVRTTDGSGGRRNESRVAGAEPRSSWGTLPAVAATDVALLARSLSASLRRREGAAGCGTLPNFP